MELNRLVELLNSIKGCTFASLDSRTKQGGCVIETTGERVMLYHTKGGSGYERKVKRELEKLGRNPDDFRVGELPWGERVDGLPLITHRGFVYLQTVQLAAGQSRYFIGVLEVPRPGWLRSSTPTGQGLPSDKAVRVHTYNIENITALRLMGETLT